MRDHDKNHQKAVDRELLSYTFREVLGRLPRGSKATSATPCANGIAPQRQPPISPESWRSPTPLRLGYTLVCNCHYETARLMPPVSRVLLLRPPTCFFRLANSADSGFPWSTPHQFGSRARCRARATAPLIKDNASEYAAGVSAEEFCSHQLADKTTTSRFAPPYQGSHQPNSALDTQSRQRVPDRQPRHNNVRKRGRRYTSKAPSIPTIPKSLSR